MDYNARMTIPLPKDLTARLVLALEARAELLAESPGGAWRLFNGFYEGYPGLVVELFARTLMVSDHRRAPGADGTILAPIEAFYRERLPWIEAVVQKVRRAQAAADRRGRLTYGEAPADKLLEGGVWYALDLTMQQDASFYLDTRNLRAWLRERSEGWTVLNTFAYTGSLGVAALAGGAAHVLQSDRSRKFLALTRRSVALNHLDLGRMKLQSQDFFNLVAHLKRVGALFDCLILDPPYFSTTKQGMVDQARESARLINKVRPLVRDGGRLVAVNNALFLSGQDYYLGLEALCQDGYLSIERLVPVPQDVTGYPHTVVENPPVDPAPFNHPTKIAVLGVRRV